VIPLQALDHRAHISRVFMTCRAMFGVMMRRHGNALKLAKAIFFRLAAPPKLKSDDAGAAGPVRGSEFFSGA
jgi:hypothetical protein